jgi:GT2 family glycosyltransferase
MNHSIRRLVRRFQDWILALRRYVPSPLQNLLRPIHRHWWLAASEHELQKAMQELASTPSQAVSPETLLAQHKLSGKTIIVIANDMDYQVVVVDNGSGPEVTHYLGTMEASQPRLKVIFNGENLGFARANNIGATAIQEYDYIVLLNNDTIVTSGWLSRLLLHLEQDKQIGMVGPVTNWASNEAKITVDYASLAEMQTFATRYTQAHAGKLQDAPMLAMFCVAMKRSVFEQVGTLDETYGLGMFEDDDYAMRLHQAGYRLAIAHDVFIHHWGWASFGRLPQQEYDRIFMENKARFEAKWGQRWRRPSLHLS